MDNNAPTFRRPPAIDQEAFWMPWTSFRSLFWFWSSRSVSIFLPFEGHIVDSRAVFSEFHPASSTALLFVDLDTPTTVHHQAYPCIQYLLTPLP